MLNKKSFYYILIAISLIVITVSAVTIFMVPKSNDGILNFSNRDPPNGMQEFPNGEPPNGMFGDMPDGVNMQEVVKILQEANGEITDEVKEKLYDLGLTDEQIEMFSNLPQGGGFPSGGEIPEGGGFPSGGRPQGSLKLYL